MFLYKLPDETPANRKMAKQIVERWSRPIFDSHRDPRYVVPVAFADRQYQLQLMAACTATRLCRRACCRFSALASCASA